jgi:hypothetical protein
VLTPEIKVHFPWRGVISLGSGRDGKRIRRKVSGTTKAVVADRRLETQAPLTTARQPTPHRNGGQ